MYGHGFYQGTQAWAAGGSCWDLPAAAAVCMLTHSLQVLGMLFCTGISDGYCFLHQRHEHWCRYSACVQELQISAVSCNR